MKKRILAIGTHPDDIEIGCGGSLRLLANKGYELKFVVITSGEKGTLFDNKNLRARREDEARRSSLVLGAGEIIFLREPDGLTFFSQEAKVQLIQIIRNYRPSIAFIHSSYDCSSDHQIVSELSRSAILAASGPWYAECGRYPHSITDVFGFEVWNPIQNPQMTINIAKTIETKMKALKIHKSQTTNINYLGAIRGLNEYRGAMTMTGKYAESFEVITLGFNL